MPIYMYLESLYIFYIHEKVSKILLDTDLKIILLVHQNNFVGKTMSNVVKNFDILETSLSALHDYFDSLTKSLF